MRLAIHWFRRDLRISDNTALNAAAAGSDAVIPVYVVSDWQSGHRWTGPNRQAFLCGCLQSLDANLRAVGSRLVIRHGDAIAALLKLAHESGARAIYTNRDPDPFGMAVEAKLREKAAGVGVEVHVLKDACMHERDEVLTGASDPYRVFTPYSRSWLKLPKTLPGSRIKTLVTPTSVASDFLPSLSTWNLSGAGDIIAPGERAARERLDAFLSGPISEYGDARDTPAGTTTSRLSQDLRFGLISIRLVVQKCEQFATGGAPSVRDSARKFIAELIWREFYMQLLWHFPDVLDHEFSPKFRNVPWTGSDAAFDRWCRAETGFPIIDAAMRQLSQTGFMHNRPRMITSMFLTKDLHVDWRRGEQWFMQMLTDGEIASNNGGWQWSAGTGADAAPYFRIQNPWTQSARFDADGAYIKHWLPELAKVPAARLHSAPEDGRPLAPGYPLPMVDHSVERDRTLDTFKKHLSAFSSES
ncbi:MAG: cryptochrome/photolyase family protein [Chthoniobacterales bacterium]